MWHLHSEVIAENMRSRMLSMDVKQTILRQKKKKKSIKQIAEMSGVVKSTVCHIMRKKTALVSLGTQKGLDIHERRQWWMNAESFQW